MDGCEFLGYNTDNMDVARSCETVVSICKTLWVNPEDGSGMILRNFALHMQDYTVSQAVRAVKTTELRLICIETDTKHVLCLYSVIVVCVSECLCPVSYSAALRFGISSSFLRLILHLCLSTS
jgi:hypothetical protein